jgi:hypothetical protein
VLINKYHLAYQMILRQRDARDRAKEQASKD